MTAIGPSASSSRRQRRRRFKAGVLPSRGAMVCCVVVPGALVGAAASGAEPESGMVGCSYAWCCFSIGGVRRARLHIAAGEVGPHLHEKIGELLSFPVAQAGQGRLAGLGGETLELLEQGTGCFG